MFRINFLCTLFIIQIKLVDKSRRKQNYILPATFTSIYYINIALWEGGLRSNFQSIWYLGVSGRYKFVIHSGVPFCLSNIVIQLMIPIFYCRITLPDKLRLKSNCLPSFACNNRKSFEILYTSSLYARVYIIITVGDKQQVFVQNCMCIHLNNYVCFTYSFEEHIKPPVYCSGKQYIGHFSAFSNADYLCNLETRFVALTYVWVYVLMWSYE